MQHDKTVYLAGKITDDPDYKKKFLDAQKRLEASGFVVVNPAMLPATGFAWEAYMRMSAAMLDECASVCFLPDWEDSPGAKIEHRRAMAAGKNVFFFNETGTGESTRHELKILPEWYESLASGLKTCEVRRDDREPPFAEGDTLFLREFDGQEYTGRTLTALVTHVLRGKYCRAGFCILSVRVSSMAGRQQPEPTREQWISVKDRLPGKEGSYLATTEKGAVVVVHYYPRHKQFSNVRWKLTHWMPMPTPARAL